MSDFETVPETDEFQPEHLDAEEPETWQHDSDRDLETDELDWVDQHLVVDDPLAEDEASTTRE